MGHILKVITSPYEIHMDTGQPFTQMVNGFELPELAIS